MSDQHMTSPGPARGDPELGDPQGPERSAPATAAGQAREVASTAGEEARDVATTARDEARGVASTAKDEGRHVAGTAREQAERLAGDARHELRQQANAQIDRLAEGVDGVSEQLRSMGRHGEPGPVTDLVQEAARRAQDLADRLRQGDLDESLHQVRSFGRNRPGLFLLGAFGAGLAAGRVARNLAQEPGDRNGGRPSSQAGRTSQQPAPGTVPGDYEAPAPAYGTTAAPVGSAGMVYGEPLPSPPVAPVSDERWGS